MKRISLISDTHDTIHPDFVKYLKSCDEIWHAGDIGTAELLRTLREINPLKAVHGNIDNQDVRGICPEIQLFMCEQVKVLMKHIGGYPGKYEKTVREMMAYEKPDVFISGHSHILKVMYDKKHKLLHMNPGASGKSGIHRKITMLQFTIDVSEIKDLIVIELDRE